MQLPYDFDTRDVTRRVLAGVIGLAALLAAAAVYIAIARHDVAGALGLLLCIALLGAFGVVVYRVLPGAEGRITHDTVATRGGRVLGLPLPGPVGTFAVRDFGAVRIERVLGPMQGAQPLRWRERVTLVGMPGTPDVMVIHAPLVHGASAGEALAALLGLPSTSTRSDW